MNKTLNKINNTVKKQGLSPIEDGRLESLTRELDKVQDLKIVWESEWGKQLSNILKANCAAAINRMVSISRNNPKLEDMLSCVFEYSSNISLLSSLKWTMPEEEIQEMIDWVVAELYGRR